MASRLPSTLRARGHRWLPADASARRYARLSRPEAAEAPTAIAMVFAPGTRPAEVERVALATRRLERAGFPVPQVYAVDAEHGWLLQEDLGDETLALARSRGRPVAQAYSDAVQLLQRIVDLRLETSPKPPLDRVRMVRELELFATTALNLAAGPGPGLAAELARLADSCATLPTVLCHRDYHSRNLMLHQGRVRVVDHQDALVGPAPYDRVSLAYDPYVELNDTVRDRIAGQHPGTAEVAVQRLAKAIGTFAEKGGHWRRWIPPAARSARRLLARDGLDYPLLDLALSTLALAADRAATA